MGTIVLVRKGKTNKIVYPTKTPMRIGAETSMIFRHQDLRAASRQDWLSLDLRTNSVRSDQGLRSRLRLGTDQNKSIVQVLERDLRSFLGASEEIVLDDDWRVSSTKEGHEGTFRFHCGKTTWQIFVNDEDEIVAKVFAILAGFSYPAGLLNDERGKKVEFG